MASVSRRSTRSTTTPTAIPTALIYTRVSSDEQAREGVSLDAQLGECRSYAARQGWVLGDEYQDVLSGSRDDRPRYQGLLADVRRRRASGTPLTVVVAKLDRFGRKLLEQVRCREELKALGVATHSVRDGGEVSDLTANILASVAQEEARQLGERVAASISHFAGAGWRVPRHCSWGYRWRAATDEERADGAPKSVLELDPDAAPAVQEAYRRVAAGESVRGVGRWVAGLPASARSGKALGYRRVRGVLSAPVYVARSEADDDPDVLARRRGKWPALVDDETFRRVQERIAGHRTQPRQASGRYLLTGLLRCARCGHRMNGAGYKSGGRKLQYQCKSQLAGATAPTRHCAFVSTTDLLDRPVLEQVVPLVAAVASTDPKLQAAIRRAWSTLQRSKSDATPSDQPRRLESLERSADKARQRLTNAAVLLVDGTIDKAGYERLRDMAQADLVATEAELARLDGQARSERSSAAPVPSLEDVLRKVGGWGTALSEADVPAKRDVLGVLVERVTHRRVGHGRYEADITWTATGGLLSSLAVATRAAVA